MTLAELKAQNPNIAGVFENEYNGWRLVVMKEPKGYTFFNEHTGILRDNRRFEFADIVQEGWACVMLDDEFSALYNPETDEVYGHFLDIETGLYNENTKVQLEDGNFAYVRKMRENKDKLETSYRTSPNKNFNYKDAFPKISCIGKSSNGKPVRLCVSDGKNKGDNNNGLTSPIRYMNSKQPTTQKKEPELVH